MKKLVASLMILMLAYGGASTLCNMPSANPTVAPSLTPEPAEAEQPTSAPEPAPLPGPAYINVNLGAEPSTLDPALATDTTSVDLDESLFLGLTDYDDETSEAIPELATTWSVSADGLKWTFEMRNDVYWVQYDPASGEAAEMRPVTAQDVEYGVKRALNPETGSGYAYVLYIIENGEAVNTGASTDLDSIGVRAVDDHTVEFTLEEPAAYFPGIAGMWVARPVPREVIEEHGDSWTETGNIWTNGPYLLAEWVHDDHIILEKNPYHYSAGDVSIETVNLFMITDASQAVAMYESGELDVTDVPRGDVLDGIIAGPKEQLATELNFNLTGCTYYYGFNTTKPPLNDVHVRRALSYAVDRQALVDTVFMGTQLPARTFASPGIFGSPAEDPSFPGIAFDPEMARYELEQAGYPGGAGLSKITLMFQTCEVQQSVAEFIAANWKEHLGIDVELANQEWATYVYTLYAEDSPQVFSWMQCADYPDTTGCWRLSTAG